MSLQITFDTLLCQWLFSNFKNIFEQSMFYRLSKFSKTKDRSYPEKKIVFDFEITEYQAAALFCTLVIRSPYLNKIKCKMLHHQIQIQEKVTSTNVVNKIIKEKSENKRNFTYKLFSSKAKYNISHICLQQQSTMSPKMHSSKFPGRCI